MNAVTEMPVPLNFSDSAANKVKSLIEEEGNPDLKLRVFVTGGGCSGFQYGFTFDEIQNEDDAVMQKNGVTLLIDPMSYQYLTGAEIDYQEGLELEAAILLEEKQAVRVAVSAVIEDASGVLSYWALKHPSDKPDFHHPD